MFLNKGAQSILLLASLVTLANCQSCRTPNNESGRCSPARTCLIYLARVQEYPLTNDRIAYLRRWQCEGPTSQPHVCCETSNPGVETATGAPQIAVNAGSGKGNVLPGRGSCGIEPTGERIYGGKATAIDEFPWMALLEYEKQPGVWSVNCGGVLINQRYVLTAGHCMKGPVEEIVGKLINVRLGEYDTSTAVDCVLGDCNDPVVNVGIEQIIAHPNYDPEEKNRYNDIGLIRLASEVTYTDFIKPICLPSVLNFERSSVGHNLTVAGWGRTLSSKKSSIKMKVNLPLYDPATCKQQFSKQGIELNDAQLCAGGNYIEDACDGDSGGPLMRPVSNYWVIEGVVSFGRSCGLEGWPGVYSRVSSHENWIRNTLSP